MLPRSTPQHCTIGTPSGWANEMSMTMLSEGSMSWRKKGNVAVRHKSDLVYQEPATLTTGTDHVEQLIDA